ncbi:MAG: hypothetical protein ACPG32_16140, partial [Akkermansiaceae bacterium]
MKLKLFGKKDKSASVPGNAASAEVEEQENSEGAEGADDSAEEESMEETESSGEGGVSEGTTEEATRAEMVGQINACTARIEEQEATIANLAAQLKKLTGDRSKEIDQAASKKAVQQTAAQGVPADEMPEAEGEGSMDEPKTMAEFQTA